MHVYVTGSGGFLGSHVVAALMAAGMRVTPISRELGDLRDASTAKNLLAAADVIVHLAANVGGVGYLAQHMSASFHDNLTLGMNVLAAACAGRCRRLILAGTPCSYDYNAALPLVESSMATSFPVGPTAGYGVAKMVCSRVAQDMCALFGKETVTFVPSNIYGPGDYFDDSRGHVVPALIKKAVSASFQKEKTFEIWGDGTATRDFVHVSDVVAGIKALITSSAKFSGEVYNFGSGVETSVADLAAKISHVVSPALSYTFAADKPAGHPRRVMCIDSAQAELGYRPVVDLDVGIRETVEWYKKSIL